MLRILTNDVALESVLKIRCSEGLRPVAIHGCGVAKTNSETNISVVKRIPYFVQRLIYVHLPENESLPIFKYLFYILLQLVKGSSVYLILSCH